MAEPKTYISASNPALKTTIADPENITRNECLELAKLGHEAWNKWRRGFPARLDSMTIANNADFSEFDFRKRQINFSGFEFGEWSNFNRTQFDHFTTFEGCIFGEGATFEKAFFAGNVSFNGSRFKTGARFVAAQFIGDAAFDAISFSSGANFKATQFCRRASFRFTEFGYGADFSGSQFGDDMNFDGTRFGGDVDFSANSWEVLTNIYLSELTDRKSVAENYGMSPQEFLSVSFKGTHFLNSVSFANRYFKDSISFSKITRPTKVVLVKRNKYSGLAIKEKLDWFNENKPLPSYILDPTAFAKCPTFHGCKLHQDTTFEDAKFPDPTGSEEAARAYRTLKLAFSQQQATREEQQFFRLEMAEEALMLRDSESWLDRGKYWLGYAPYSAFSRYGFSVLRPVVLFFGVLAAFAAIYAWQAGLHWDWNENSYGAALLQFAAAHSLPGLEKLADPAALQLFGEIPGVKGAANYGLGTVLALLFHKAFSLLALFLAGLALRNWFKMK